MKSYEIITITKEGRRFGSKSTFLTKGRSIKSALRNLLGRSVDFKIITEGRHKINIVVKEIK